MTLITPDRLEAAYRTVLNALLAERTPDGHWVGELSTSALSTATAISALALVQTHTGSRAHDQLIAGGVAWLAALQNADGGWGDTVKSFSNISTTMLCRAAFHLTGAAQQYADCLARAEKHLAERYGQTPEQLAESVRRRYGKDRTFAVPILTTCALAGLVSWREVPSLPFELACFPQSWFRFLRLQVVSYALPALIAIGQAVYHHRPPWNPIAWLTRRLAIRRSLRVLEKIQPSNGGFLEAAPLTSFVTLSLASIGLADHVVARKGVNFLVNAVRPDGSWPIDTNLATWVTTLAVNALAGAGDLQSLDRLDHVRDWLLGQQHWQVHPYTGAGGGGWGWTDLPGGVPDADDTAGSILALTNINRARGVIWDSDARVSGAEWLIEVQNRDGGWPTFCKGWGALPFDRSGPDLTAHALRGVSAWLVDQKYLSELDYDKAAEIYGMPIIDPKPYDRRRGLTYLAHCQRPDGSWLPLWFGNQHAPDDENPTYGTARVLAAYRDLDMMETAPAQGGIRWLLSAQNADGGWGGAVGVPSSIEETALAVEVLLDAGPTADAAVNKGLAWLVQQVESGGHNSPTPIGFYFAKLWYFERLYPLIFTVAALGRARNKSQGPRTTNNT